LKIIPDGHHTQVKVAHTQRSDELLVGAVPDLGAGDKGEHFVDPLLHLVHRHHIVF
jgi:hypothetical protein